MEDEEFPECRICRCEGDEDRPLFHPCACTGSIRWCHESCLVEWIKVSRSREYCETCGTQLVFRPEYSESTPTTLSLGELTWLGFKRAVKELPYLMRASTVSFIWLVFIPIWSSLAFAYLRPPIEISSDEPSSTWIEWLWSRPSPLSFSMWETGVWILLAGFFWLFTLVSVFDFVRGFELGEYAPELEAFRLRARGRLGGDAEAAVDNHGQHLGNEALRPIAEMAENDDADEFEDMEDEHEGEQLAEVQPANGENNANNNENEGARNENFDDLAGEQLGFDEWIGLRGPWCLLVNNVLCLCFCVLLFLVTFYVIPESLGRGVLREGWKASTPITTATMEALNRTGVTSEFIEFSRQMVPFRQFSQQLPRLLEFDFQMKKIEACDVVNPLLGETLRGSESHVCDKNMIKWSMKRIEQYTFETLSVIVGMLITVAIIQIQFSLCRCGWINFARAWFQPTHPLRGFPNQVWRMILRSTRTIVRVQKVGCLLVFKMIGFPIVLGVLINAALKPALTISDADRLLFIADYPHLTAMLLWVAGITHTLMVTMNVILVRDILHHEVLDGIIRMRDPHGNQFLPLLVEPIIQQTKRTMVTCFIYTVIVVMFVFIPSYVAQQFNLLPVPMTMRFVSVGLQLPVESTLFHMWMLHVLEKTKPVMVQTQTTFFRTMCHLLGLTEFLLPVPINPIEYAQAIHRAQVQAGQLHWLDSAPRVSNGLLRPRIRPSWAWLRVSVLILLAWTFWFSVVLACVALPYLIGVAAVSCLPALPNWVRTDVRLYFVGWFLLRSLKQCLPRLVLYHYRIVQYASRNLKEFACFAAAGLFFAILFPLVAGSFVYLEMAFSGLDFPADKYMETSSIPLYVAFARDYLSKLSLGATWFAGFPFVILVSCKTLTGRNFWRCIHDWRLVQAGQLATKSLLISIASLITGMLLGLEFWHRGGITSSPIYTVRTAVCLVVCCAMAPSYAFRYYELAKSGCKRLHDTLKDDKYLMGRRLRNYDARVV